MGIYCFLVKLVMQTIFFFPKLLLLRKITMPSRLPKSKKIAVYIHEV